MTPAAYLRKILQELPDISAQTGYSTPFLAWQFLRCYLSQHAEIDEFRTLRLYDLSAPRRKQYLTYKESKCISDLLNRDADAQEVEALNNKRLINELFAPYIGREWLYLPASSRSEVSQFLETHDVFLKKACVGTQGKSIELLTTADLDPDAFYEENCSADCILEERIKQHPLLDRVNPYSVNTIRIISARIGEHVCPIGAGLRCGGAGQFVDNFHHGGIAYPIDIETGIITGPGVDLDGHPVLRHPTTGFVMPGLQIPFWPETLALLRAAAVLPPHIGYVGWDLAITPDGPILVEANINYPGNNIIQIDGPGPRERLLRFLRENGK